MKRKDNPGASLLKWAKQYQKDGNKYPWRDLAYVTGIHRTTLSAIARGDSRPSVQVAALIELGTEGSVLATDLIELDYWLWQARKDRKRITTATILQEGWRTR